MALGRIAIGKAKIKSLEIDELTVKRLRAADVSISESLELP